MPSYGSQFNYVGHFLGHSRCRSVTKVMEMKPGQSSDSTGALENLFDGPALDRKYAPLNGAG